MGKGGFSSGAVVKKKKKKSTCNARDTRDVGSVPGSGRSPGVGKATRSSILAWKILWMEDPCGITVHGVTKSHMRLSTSSD